MSNKDTVQNLLAFFTRKIIAKYQPFVVGITGSVGKTSTRHAIACALKYKFKLREAQRNYNNEKGIPLAVFGADEINNKVDGLKAIIKGFFVWMLPQNYPKMLILEYGIDRPGDMDYYLSLVKPNLAVFTTVGMSHRKFFNSEQEIAKEKVKIASQLNGNEFFVYNADDPNVSLESQNVHAQKISFGKQSLGHDANVELLEVKEDLALHASTTMRIKTPSREITVTIPVLGTAHVQAVLAAVAVADALEVDTDLVLQGLADYRPVPGRLNVLAGIKRSILIDDSYNAAPVSATEAIKLLDRFPRAKKIAVLGDMLELGDESDSAHAQIGKLAASLNLQKLVTIGELGKKIAIAAQEAGMSQDKIISFNNSDEAKQQVLQMIEPETVVLVKGSQGARMEKISKELLAEPMKAPQVLPRQYGKWLNS